MRSMLVESRRRGSLKMAATTHMNHDDVFEVADWWWPLL